MSAKYLAIVVERAASELLFAPRSTEVNRTAESNRSKQVNWSRSKLERESIKRVWFVVRMLDACWRYAVVDKYRNKVKANSLKRRVN